MESGAVLLSTCFHHLRFAGSNSGNPRVVKFAASGQQRLNTWPRLVERSCVPICSAFHEHDLCAIRKTQLGLLRTYSQTRIRRTSRGRIVLVLRTNEPCAAGA